VAPSSAAIDTAAVTSLRSTLCLLYPPDVICVGVIALSLKYKEMEEPVRYGVPVTEQTKPWHEELFGVDRQTIERQHCASQPVSERASSEVA